MRITSVETRVTGFSGGKWLDEDRVSTPFNAFPRFSERRSSWRGPGADLVYVLVRTDDPQVFGVGQSRGGTVTERLILDHLAALLVGQDPRPVRVRYEEMSRAVLPYADGGIGAMATAAVELALWDLLARSLGAPLYQVLGGERASLPYYVTCASADVLPALFKGTESSVTRAIEAVKLPVAYGPPAGFAGMQANLERLEQARSVLGTDVPLAIDCFMSWDLAYTVEFARRAADLGLAWIEEPLHPHAVAEHAELRRLISPIRVATGEHIYQPALAHAYLQQRAVDVFQLDLTWCGGLHVGQALAAAATTHNVRFAPHSAGLQPWAVHLLSTLGPLGLAEVLVGVTGTTLPSGVEPSSEPGVGIDPRSLGFEL